MNEIINHHQRRRSVNNWLGKTAIPARLRGKARAIRSEVDIEIAKALGIENNTAAEGYIDLLQYRRLLRENFREIIRQHENDSCKQTHENSKPWDDLSAQDRSSGAYLERD